MFRDLVKSNRSYRGFDESVPMTKEQLLSYVDLTRMTASSVNLQPLKYHIAYEKNEVAQIQSLTKWAAKQPQFGLPREGHRPTAFVIICHDKAIAPNAASFQKDVGIVAQTILLAATEDGFGGCMIGNFRADEMKELLKLPETLDPQLVLGLGKPAEKIVLTEVGTDGSTDYYRDEADVHYVPKRALKDILC